MACRAAVTSAFARKIRRIGVGAALAVSALTAFAAPYSGTPVPLPATIEAEDFDRGGEGTGYRDLTAANGGGQYRPAEGVDIVAGPAAEGGGFVVNGFQTSEWLAYTVNVPATGTYTLALRAASNYASPTAFHIEVDGARATGSIPVPRTGSWGAFQWVAAPAITLAAGTRVIKVVADAQYFNLNRLRIEAAAGGDSAAAPSPSYAGTPYSGAPVALPRVFEAEDFDRGGRNVAYHDKSSGNAGGEYRTGEDVDIFASRDSAGGRYVVARFQTGEWLAYTVDVPASGSYDLSIRAANNNWPAAFRIEVDGVDATGKISMPSTGSWSRFQWVGKHGVSLSAGRRVLKLVNMGEYFDVNQISVLAAASGGGAPAYAGTPYSGTPVALPGTFEAEDFDRGGQGVAYHDKSAGNGGAAYRTGEDVDITASRDPSGGGHLIASFQSGEWLAYTVNVPASGNYDLSIRAANDDWPAAFRIEVDGVDVAGRIPVPDTGGWSNFEWVGKKGVALAAGKRVLKLVSDGEYFDVNQISVVASAASTAEPASPVAVPVPGAIAGQGYRLVKNWDFAGAIRTQEALRAEFHTRYLWSNGTLDFLNDEWQRYRDNGNHVFVDGALALVARLPAGTSLAPGNIESGMLRSRWSGQYGYFEARVKVPGGAGMWPAFWMLSQDGVWPPEIDVMEIVNNGRDGTQNSFHFVHGTNEAVTPTYSLLDQWGSYRPGLDYKDGFHTFAVEWTPDRVRHYVDDRLVVDRPWRFNHDDGTSGGPAHVLLNLAVGGSWPGAPTSSSLPAQLLVQHIRVWQR